MSAPTINEPRTSVRAVQRITVNRAPVRTVTRIKLGVRPRPTLPADCIRVFTEVGVGLRSLSIYWDHDQPGWQIVTCDVQSCSQPIARQIADRIAGNTGDAKLIEPRAAPATSVLGQGRQTANREPAETEPQEPPGSVQT